MTGMMGVEGGAAAADPGWVPAKRSSATTIPKAPVAFSHRGLLFRPVETEDLDAVRRLRNDESTWVHLSDPRILFPADQEAWLDRLEREHANLRAALRWALDAGEAEIAGRLGSRAGNERREEGGSERSEQGWHGGRAHGRAGCVTVSINAQVAGTAALGDPNRMSY